MHGNPSNCSQESVGSNSPRSASQCTWRLSQDRVRFNELLPCGEKVASSHITWTHEVTFWRSSLSQCLLDSSSPGTVCRSEGKSWHRRKRTSTSPQWHLRPPSPTEPVTANRRFHIFAKDCWKEFYLQTKELCEKEMNKGWRKDSLLYFLLDVVFPHLDPCASLCKRLGLLNLLSKGFSPEYEGLNANEAFFNNPTVSYIFDCCCCCLFLKPLHSLVLSFFLPRL